MNAHHAFEPVIQPGALYSRMMVAIVLCTTLAVLWFGPQSRTTENFAGRTPSTFIGSEGS